MGELCGSDWESQHCVCAFGPMNTFVILSVVLTLFTGSRGRYFSFWSTYVSISLGVSYKNTLYEPTFDVDVFDTDVWLQVGPAECDRRSWCGAQKQLLRRRSDAHVGLVLQRSCIVIFGRYQRVASDGGHRISQTHWTQVCAIMSSVVEVNRGECWDETTFP